MRRAYWIVSGEGLKSTDFGETEVEYNPMGFFTNLNCWSIILSIKIVSEFITHNFFKDLGSAMTLIS